MIESDTFNKNTLNQVTSDSWTIMLYMAGDNNLNDDMITSIRDLQRATSSRPKTDLTFVVELDSQHPMTPTKRYIIKNGKVTPERPDTETEIASDAIKNLIEYCKKKHSADKYALVVSGHSDAFQGRTLLVDENPPGITTLNDLKSKIETGLKNCKIEKLEIIGFEGCVMNTLEVMYQFRDIAKVWIGSQGSIPNYAWDYYRIGIELTKQHDLTNEKIVKIIINSVRDYHCEYSFAGRSVDISAIDLTKIPGLVKELEKWMLLLNLSIAVPFLEFLFDDEFDFLQHPILRMILGSHWKSQTFMRDQSIDLIDFVEILKKVCLNYADEMDGIVNDSIPCSKCDSDEKETNTEKPPCLKCRHRLFNKLMRVFSDKGSKLTNYITDNKIVLKGASTGLEYNFANGISMFFPWTILSYHITKKNYKAEIVTTGKSVEGLKFLDKKSGKLWLNFLIYFLVMTERPKGKLGDAFTKILNRLLKILITILKETKIPNVNNTTTILSQKLTDQPEYKMTPIDLARLIDELSCLILELIKNDSIDDLNERLENIQIIDIFEKIDSEMLKEFKGLLVQLNETFNKQILGGTRDDHIKTREGIDSIVNYFGRYRNLRVKELNIGPRNFGAQ